MEFRGYYGKHKRKKESVGQTVVGQPTVKKSSRFEKENFDNIMKKVEHINSLDDNMKTDFSKTLNNILFDYFLDEEIEVKKFELDEI